MYYLLLLKLKDITRTSLYSIDAVNGLSKNDFIIAKIIDDIAF